MGRAHVYTGNGKGKTTAALGLALRAVGAGWRVYIGQFLKNAATSETEAIRRYLPDITIEAYGDDKLLTGRPEEKDFAAAARGLEAVRRAVVSGVYRLVIADEINVAVHFGLLSSGDAIGLIDAAPPEVELVLTGRYASPELLERADLVTEAVEVKHYYHGGVSARKGVEF